MDPNWFGLVIGMSCFEMCGDRRGIVHSMPVLLPCFTSSPYDMPQMTCQVLREMDYSWRICNVRRKEIGVNVETYISLKNLAKDLF